MKRILTITVILSILTSCNNYNSGELTGVPGRGRYFEPEPYGMVFIPQGSFNMGPSDQDVAWAQTSFSKTVSVEAFWMDETEITNNEYRQFVYWVRDSIMRRMLGQQLDDFVTTEDQYGNPIDPPLLNWDVEIDHEDEEITEILNDMYYKENERFFGRKEV
ncbi:MAG: formylglycine-generating enzyme family protein, partial [Bacteroidota bacterium]